MTIDASIARFEPFARSVVFRNLFHYAFADYLAERESEAEKLNAIAKLD